MHALIDPDDPAVRAEAAAVLATLVAATGSTSKKLGAKMLVGASGRIVGGVTIGGCIDARVIEAADALIAAGGRRLLSISLDDDEAWEIGLTCGGTVEVLLERVSPRDDSDRTIAAHRRAAELVAAGEVAIVMTPIDPAGPPFSIAEAEFANTVVTGRVFADRIAPPVTLVIIGAGEIAIALTRYARVLDMRSVVVDGRQRYATPERFPEADRIAVGMPSEIVGDIRPTPRVAVILVAHDYKYELPVLRRVLREPVGYIGMLGSKRRGAAVRELLRADGFSDDELARIHTPIGIDVGGRESAEVAMAIIAEVVAVMHGTRP